MTRDAKKQCLTHRENVSLLNGQCLAGRPSVHMCQNINLAIFAVTVNVINVDFCIIVVLIELCLFVPQSVTFILFQGHNSVRQFLTRMKNVYIMISVRPACRLSVCGKHFNVAIFSDTINLITVKLHIMVVLIELYRFIPLSMPLIVLQGHSSVLYLM